MQDSTFSSFDQAVDDTVSTIVSGLSNTAQTADPGWNGILNTAGEVVFLVAAIIGSFVAIEGLRTWKKKLKGHTEYDAARRLMKAVYSVRSGFSHVRRPMVFPGEVDRAIQETGIDPEQDGARWESGVHQDRAVYTYRARVLDDAFDQLNLELLEAEVLWGPIVRETSAHLFQLRGRLVASVSAYLRLKRRRTLSEDERKRYAQYEEAMWEIGSGEDADSFTKEIHEAVSKFETFIKPHLEL